MNHDELHESLLYLRVSELKEVADLLKLPNQGNKGDLVERIVHFLKTGRVKEMPSIPTISRARPGFVYALAPEEKMLHGAYKNDARTRAFFKQLIGEHFHFTAHGIDWLRERWLAGAPPTYAEFARMWQEVYEKGKTEKPVPKDEWAYIRFVQQFNREVPGASKVEILTAWEAERARYVEKVRCFIQKASTGPQ